MIMPSPVNNPHANLVKRIFRKLFTELIGENSLKILELRLRKTLGEDPYIALCKDPVKFSAELKNILGGVDNLLRVAANKLVDDYSLKNLDLFASSKKADEIFFDLLFEASRKAAERIAPGAISLALNDTEIISNLLKLAMACGGIDEQVNEDMGWAVKMKSIIILGIKYNDKMIPVALYSKRYTRFDLIARRWLEEVPLIFRATINELKLD